MTAPSNGPWILVDIDFRDACDHFSKAVGIFGEGDRFERPDMEGYEAKMALMHSLQCGHTSLENGLLRILRILNEPFVREEGWHHDLIVQCGTETADRGAILENDLIKHAQNTRAFRNIATRQYRMVFVPDRAKDAVHSGAVLSKRLPACIEAFKSRVDPPDDRNNNDGGGDESGGAMGGGP